MRSVLQRFGAVGVLVAGVLVTGADRTAAPPPTEQQAPAVELPARPNTIRNPVREHAADPFVAIHGGAYHLTYTRGDRLVIVKAASIAGLEAAPETTVHTGCCNIWAPELHQLNGRWYLYYTADDGVDRNHRMYVLESAGGDPMGPYTFKAQLNTGNFHSIDGTVLRMPDGRLFFAWASGRSDGQHTFIAPMSNPWTTSGPPVLLIRADQAWERHNGAIAEAPVALVRNGKVFLAYSGSNCNSPDYAIGMMEYTGGDVLNPASWTKLPGPLFKRSDSAWVFGTGHNGFFTSPDGSETWLVYHGVTNSSGTVFGSCGGDRATRIGKVTFDASGRPVLGVPKASWQSMTLPAGDPGADIVADGLYKLLPKNNTGNALDVVDCSTEDGANVRLWADVGSPCQKWRLEYLGDGSYKFTANHSGKALDVANCSPANHADVIQWPYWGGDCQEWYLDKLPDGYYRITSKVGGKALDVDLCSTQAGADVRVWPYWQGDCQKWRLVPTS